MAKKQTKKSETHRLRIKQIRIQSDLDLLRGDVVKLAQFSDASGLALYLGTAGGTNQLHVFARRPRPGMIEDLYATTFNLKVGNKGALYITAEQDEGRNYSYHSEAERPLYNARDRQLKKAGILE